MCIRDIVKPILQELRERWANRQFLAHMEQAARRFEVWMENRSPGHIATMRQMMAQMRPQTAKSA